MKRYPNHEIVESKSGVVLALLHSPHCAPPFLFNSLLRSTARWWHGLNVNSKATLLWTLNNSKTLSEAAYGDAYGLIFPSYILCDTNRRRVLAKAETILCLCLSSVSYQIASFEVLCWCWCIELLVDSDCGQGEPVQWQDTKVFCFYHPAHPLPLPLVNLHGPTLHPHWPHSTFHLTEAYSLTTHQVRSETCTVQFNPKPIPKPNLKQVFRFICDTEAVAHLEEQHGRRG